MTARIFNVLIGTWLFLSAFAWPHNSAQGFTALICGALTVLFTLATTYAAGARYLTALTAAVLFMAAVAFRTRWDATFWHNAIIAVAIFAAAVLDKGPAGARHERELYGRV
jgi:hypothetical protein